MTKSEIPLLAENSHAEYFRVGQGVTVTWMGGYRLYLCLTCRTNECEHTAMVEAEHHRLEAAGV